MRRYEQLKRKLHRIHKRGQILSERLEHAGRDLVRRTRPFRKKRRPLLVLEKEQFDAFQMDFAPAAKEERHLKSCLVLEGGSLRGIYSSGVLQVLQEAGVHFDTVMGISAGALNGMAWLSGQLDRAVRINTELIMHPQYIHAVPTIDSRSMINFDFLFDGYEDLLEPFDMERFYGSPTHYVCAATAADTGLIRYFEKGSCQEIRKAAIASASLPFLTPGVWIEGVHYYDGGLAEPIILPRALADGYGRIVVLLTREKGFLKEERHRRFRQIARIRYPGQSALLASILRESNCYQRSVRRVEEMEAAGKVFVIRPAKSVALRFSERSPERMESILRQANAEAKAVLPALKTYLRQD